MKKILTAIIITVAMATGVTNAQELTLEQQGELFEVGIQYAQKASLFEGMIQGKLIELGVELNREGRLDSDKIARKSAKKANAILKDIGGLYGEFVKSQVAFMLEAKNILTVEQKLYLLENLEPRDLMAYEEVDFLQPEIFELPINLNLDQRRKLIKLEADLTLEEVKLERDIELVLLEFEGLFMEDSIDSSKVDKQVMKLASLAADIIETRVDYFIKAKDVLTLDQKRMLSYLLGL